jgi:hypothetical protein
MEMQAERMLAIFLIFLFPSSSRKTKNSFYRETASHHVEDKISRQNIRCGIREADLFFFSKF